MFNNGDIVKVGYKGRLGSYEWTVLDAEGSLLGSPSFLGGHDGDMGQFKGTVWEGHCWFIPRGSWESISPVIQENE